MLELIVVIAVSINSKEIIRNSCSCSCSCSCIGSRSCGCCGWSGGDGRSSNNNISGSLK